MGFLITYLLTVVASIAMEIKLGTRVYKDYADEGYIFNPKRNKEVSNDNYESYGKNNLLLHFVPFINVLNEIKKVSTYNKEFEESIDGMLSQGCIRKMTKEEQEAYKKRPTWLNSMKIANESEQKNIDEHRLNRLDIYHEEDDEHSIISYNFLGGKINVLGATGHLCDKSEEYLKDVLLKASIAISFQEPSVVEHYGIKCKEANDYMCIVEMNDKILLDAKEDEFNEVIESVKEYAKEATEKEDRPEVSSREFTINDNGKEKVLKIERRRTNK